MPQNNSFPYKPSKPALLGNFLIMFLLTRGELPLIGYLLGFAMFSLLLVLDYAVQWEKARVKH